jgi:hypothetical protein
VHSTSRSLDTLHHTELASPTHHDGLVSEQLKLESLIRRINDLRLYYTSPLGKQMFASNFGEPEAWNKNEEGLTTG